MADSDWISDFQHRLQVFASDRGWQRFHTPRNLFLALVGEVGELAAVLQWRTDREVDALDEDTKLNVSDELADVFIYLVQLAGALDVDLRSACNHKLVKNAIKYPPTRSRETS